MLLERAHMAMSENGTRMEAGMAVPGPKAGRSITGSARTRMSMIRATPRPRRRRPSRSNMVVMEINGVSIIGSTTAITGTTQKSSFFCAFPAVVARAGFGTVPGRLNRLCGDFFLFGRFASFLRSGGPLSACKTSLIHPLPTQRRSNVKEPCYAGNATNRIIRRGKTKFNKPQYEYIESSLNCGCCRGGAGD